MKEPDKNSDYQAFAKRQIDAITETLTEVMFGDFDVVARTVDADDTFGYLCIMINVAINAARNAKSDIEKTREVLAEQVRDRTAELSIAMERLREESRRHKSIKEEAVETRNYLDEILLNMPVGVAILEGPDFRYYRINQILADLNGLPTVDHLGKTVSEVLGNEAETVVSTLRKVRRTGHAILGRQFSMRLPTSPNEDLHLMDYMFPIKGRDGTSRAVVVVGAISTDILDFCARVLAIEGGKGRCLRRSLLIGRP